ncbi:hypothetical protein [Thiococcus pfennigii]|jgi:hypothetical protein|uniref:hypothetical protein n=1 Tax=Thiococcus pfennigii TaxID=1057 RepID=UPI001902F6BD|nr:hypothetical protein [Thiococcus pfennigii]
MTADMLAMKGTLRSRVVEALRDLAHGMSQGRRQRRWRLIHEHARETAPPPRSKPPPET